MKNIIKMLMIVSLIFAAHVPGYAADPYAGVGRHVAEKGSDAARDALIGAVVITGITWFVVHKIRKNRKNKRLSNNSKIKKITRTVQVGFTDGDNKNQAREGHTKRPTISATNQQHRNQFF